MIHYAKPGHAPDQHMRRVGVPSSPGCQPTHSNRKREKKTMIRKNYHWWLVRSFFSKKNLEKNLQMIEPTTNLKKKLNGFIKLMIS